MSITAIENILIILFIIIFIIFVIIYTLGIINYIIYKVPQVGTFNSDFKVMRKGLQKYNLTGKKLIDLGSGTGKVLRFFEKEFNIKTTGYEIDLGNYLISIFLNKILNYKSNIYNKNYFKANLKDFDIIYVYLFPELINKIEDKIWQESNKGTIIISNAFKFNKHSPIEILKDDKNKEELYIYKK